MYAILLPADLLIRIASVINSIFCNMHSYVHILDYNWHYEINIFPIDYNNNTFDSNDRLVCRNYVNKPTFTPKSRAMNQKELAGPCSSQKTCDTDELCT